ncbi:MAG: insulinase family protein [Rhodopirellula sp.]|nr:insulinase family protein [Rhodopirellula sp.]
MKTLFILVLAMLGSVNSTAIAADETLTAIPADQVVALPVENDPSVSFRIWFAVGSQDDPPGKEGLAALTAAVLAEGATREHDYQEILDLLFPMAGRYGASASMEMTVISGRIHGDKVASYYPLLAQAILMPAFKQEELERLKSEALNYLENSLRYASDEELGKAVLYNTIFAGTPYGHLTEGTVEGLRSITLDDVRNFYRRHYTRDNVVIGIGGSYAPALLDRLRNDLGGLPAGKPTQVPPPQPMPIEGRKVVLVEKNAPATAISLGFPIPVRRGSRDWYALAIANSWLGEHRKSSSHLYQVLREARGLNYGDYSYIEHFPGGGYQQMPPQNVARRQHIFEIWIRPVPNEAKHFALRAALRELKTLVDRGMSQQQFDLTRKFLKNYVLHYAPTTSERLGYAVDDRFYGIEGSHLEKFRRMMDEITLDEVNAAIRTYLQYDNMVIAAVTPDAAEFKKALLADAPSPYRYPTPKPKEILDEDAAIATFPLVIEPENVRIVPVEELFVK